MKMNFSSLKKEKAEKEYREKYEFKVLCDFENLWLESSYPLDTLYDKIQEALQTINKTYYIYGKIIACGVEKTTNACQISVLRGTGKLEFMLDVQVNCNCSVCVHPFQSVANRKSAHPFARNTDLADGHFIKHMFLHAIGELPKKSNVLIITTDSDFTSTIMDLVLAKCKVMGCIDHESSSRLCNAGKTTWFWDRLIVGGERMKNSETFGRTWMY